MAAAASLSGEEMSRTSALWERGPAAGKRMSPGICAPGLAGVPARHHDGTAFRQSHNINT